MLTPLDCPTTTPSRGSPAKARNRKWPLPPFQPCREQRAEAATTPTRFRRKSISKSPLPSLCFNYRQASTIRQGSLLGEHIEMTVVHDLPLLCTSTLSWLCIWANPVEANRTKSAPVHGSAKLHKHVQMQASCICRPDGPLQSCRPPP